MKVEKVSPAVTDLVDKLRGMMSDEIDASDVEIEIYQLVAALSQVLGQLIAGLDESK